MAHKGFSLFKLASLPALGLSATVAHASFNSWGSSPLCESYTCVLWLGGGLGIVGIPLFIVIFFGLARVFGGRGAPKDSQAWILVNAVVCYALAAALLFREPGHNHGWFYVLLYMAIAVGYLGYRRQGRGRIKPTESDQA